MKEAPDHWDFAAYNNDKKKPKMQAFSQQNGATPITSPHHQNCAFIFNSNLFDETDVIEFQDTYECGLINLSLLYGHRQQSR